MITKTITVEIPAGLEVRPVAVLVQVANQYSSSIYVESGNKKVNAKSIMGLMTLGLRAGESVTVHADGSDEEDAVDKIDALPLRPARNAAPHEKVELQYLILPPESGIITLLSYRAGVSEWQTRGTQNPLCE